MRTVAVLMGFISGVLLALVIELVRMNPLVDDAPSVAALLFTLAVGWGLSTWLLLRRAEGVLAVMQRGFLAGIVEWLVIGMIVTVVKRGMAVAADAGPMGGRASWEPAARQVSMVTSMQGSFTTALAALCLVGWGITFLLGRARRRSADRRRSANATTATQAS
jgi:hypothetical protein